MHVTTSWNEVLAPSNIAPKWFQFAKEKGNIKIVKFKIIICLPVWQPEALYIENVNIYIYRFIFFQQQQIRKVFHINIYKGILFGVRKKGWSPLELHGILHSTDTASGLDSGEPFSGFILLLVLGLNPESHASFGKGHARLIVSMQSNYIYTVFGKPIYKNSTHDG